MEAQWGAFCSADGAMAAVFVALLAGLLGKIRCHLGQDWRLHLTKALEASSEIGSIYCPVGLKILNSNVRLR